MVDRAATSIHLSIGATAPESGKGVDLREKNFNNLLLSAENQQHGKRAANDAK